MKQGQVKISGVWCSFAFLYTRSFNTSEIYMWLSLCFLSYYPFFIS
jgi:hypothetical protein